MRERVLLLEAVQRQERGLLQAGRVVQQVVEEGTGLEALDAKEQRRGEAVVVEVAERIKAIHVPEVKQRDALAILHDVAVAKIPLEEASELERNNDGEDLLEDRSIKALQGVALDPRREDDAI